MYWFPPLFYFINPVAVEYSNEHFNGHVSVKYVTGISQIKALKLDILVGYNSYTRENGLEG
jgi:hypothetical protein